MLDVSKKIKTLRTAQASAIIKLKSETIDLIKLNKIPKGNPLEVAKVAGIQAAKNTSNIIPYCHPISIDFVGVDYNIGENQIEILTTVKAIYKTGVEMEALTAASVAALTIYDMTKMLDETITITEIKLLYKKGGKSDFKTVYERKLTAAVLVMSDSIYSGKKSDQSGKMIVDRLTSEGIDVVDYKIVPDDEEQIVSELMRYTDELNTDLVITTGGTGFSTRDRTPEAMNKIIEKEIPGIPEAIRVYGQERTPFSMLSRAKSGIRKNTLIINLPGSKKGVEESLDALFPAVLHSFKMMAGGGH